MIADPSCMSGRQRRTLHGMVLAFDHQTSHHQPLPSAAQHQYSGTVSNLPQAATKQPIH